MSPIPHVISLSLALGVVACGPGVSEPGASTSDGATAGEASGDERGAGADGGRDVDGGDADGTAGKDTKGDADGGDPDDPNSGEALRNCLGCWEENSGACPEVRACKEDLACSQLLDCPYACGATAECVAECNEIIPSGVDLVTEAMACMVCNGGPCAAECMNDAMQSYCG